VRKVREYETPELFWQDEPKEQTERPYNYEDTGQGF
jgi:hypothetical protein